MTISTENRIAALAARTAIARETGIEQAIVGALVFGMTDIDVHVYEWIDEDCKIQVLVESYIAEDHSGADVVYHEFGKKPEEGR